MTSTNRFPSFLFIGLVLLAGSLAADLARAHIPPSSFLVRSVARKHAGLRTLRVRSQVFAMEGDKTGPLRFKVSTLWQSQNRSLKTWVTDEAGNALYAQERREGNIPAAALLLVETDASRLAQKLVDQGVPIQREEQLAALKDEEERRSAEVQSMGRMKSSVSWVVGQVSQLWVEKDTFLPMRLILAGASGGAVDVRYESYRFYNETPYPRAITLFRQNAGVFREEIADVTTAPTASEIKQMPAITVAGFTDAGNSAPSEVRDLIRQYFEVLR